MCLLLICCRRFYSSDIKVLRVAMSSIFDMTTVSLKTLMEFDVESDDTVAKRSMQVS